MLILLAFLALALLRGVLYTAVVPPWQTPDEPRHLEYARLIADTGRLTLTGKDLSVSLQQQVIDSMVRFRYWDLGYYSYPYDPANLPQAFNQVWVEAHEIHQQPLYYALCAMVIWPWRADDVLTQMYVLRLLSVVLFAGTVLAAWLTARDLFPANRGLSIAITAGVLWQPMFTHISASVNNDVLANLLMAWVVWLLVRWYMRGFRVWQALVIVGLLLVGIVTKRTTLFVWPLVMVAVPLYLWGRGRWGWLVGVVGMAAAGLGTVALVVAAPSHPVLARILWDLGFATDLFQNPDAYQLTDPAVYAAYAQNLFITFWGAFGWTAASLEMAWYYLLTVVVAAAAGGWGLLAWRAWRKRSPLDRNQAKALLLLALAMLLQLVIVVVKQLRMQTFLAGGLPQGRFLFPVLVPVVILLVVGLYQWVPVRWHRPALPLFLGAVMLFDALCLWNYAVPFFYL